MSKINLSEVTLPQEDIEVDGDTYLVTALPATQALQFMERYQESMDKGKADLAMMKEIIVKTVCKDGKVITDKSFDTIFARRFVHLSKLYEAVIEYNFADVFQEPDSED